jgi:hypothetical protein
LGFANKELAPEYCSGAEHQQEKILTPLSKHGLAAFPPGFTASRVTLYEPSRMLHFGHLEKHENNLFQSVTPEKPVPLNVP